MGKKKRFITKKTIRWKIVDTIVLALIFVYSAGGIILNIDKWIESLIDCPVIIIPFFIFGIVLNSLPYLIVYVSLRYTIKKYNRSVATFDVEHDLEYYREKFNGVSPATMSLLMDLNLETDKDIGAMKLYYELHDIYMYVHDGKVCLNNPKGIRINKSDEILLKYFFDNKNKFEALNEWKENVICESVNNNLIARKTWREKKKVGCGFFMFLHILSFLILMFCGLNINMMNELMAMIEGAETIQFFYDSLISNSKYIFAFILLLIGGISCIIWIYSFVGGIIHLIVGNIVAVKDKFKRTKEGNRLAEQLYGMKNFINDFSNLDEASKKHLVLWDEFLIYAVVLEENDTILKEISNMYHKDLLNYKNFKN